MMGLIQIIALLLAVRKAILITMSPEVPVLVVMVAAEEELLPLLLE